ncbi:hypothetical protein DENIS_3218 [Desulfonema ishimotonii]|uniref:Uncharacterized protein n=1 Tax=Desulfonema ishimotonii TaxID=45657 RepID=A0A401FZ47_9BACT|nr:hypothetical protein [Desulfonema ishimotonii]GBC62249.1 hypothetical protein DENIS_3218 [Desulfonema ishimotonii]
MVRSRFAKFVRCPVCLRPGKTDVPKNPLPSGMGSTSNTPENSSESEIPKSYRGWNLNKRGKNKKGEILFNLAKKIGGKKRQKYLGIWNRDKADRIIDEMNRKYKSELQTPS